MSKIVKVIQNSLSSFLSSKSGLKVNFVICGTQKGGTTVLDTCLRGHPEVCMANTKEVHFFDNDEYFSSGHLDYEDYHCFFSPKSTHKVIGEATPSYMYWRDAAKRMWEYNPEMKLIVILRNPIERAYSHWNMERLRKNESLSFWDTIQNECERCGEALPYQHKVYSYIDRGFYVGQLRRLWEYFTRERVLIIRNEDLRNQPGKTLDKICCFLGIDLNYSFQVKAAYVSLYVASISEREKEFLRSIYEDEIRELEKMLDWDCGDWLSD